MKSPLALVVAACMMGLCLTISALPTADADANPGPLPFAKAKPEAKPEVIPGRHQHNPILLIYDLLASFVAYIPNLGAVLAEILGLGRR